MELKDYVKDLEHDLRLERAYGRSLGEDLSAARETIRVQGEFILMMKRNIAAFLSGEF